MRGVELRRLYMDLKEDTIRPRDLTANERRYVLGWIRSEIKRLTELKNRVVEFNPQMQGYNLDQIPDYNDLVRVQQMIEGKGSDISNSELALLMVYRNENMKNDRSDLSYKFAKYRKRVNRLGTEDSQKKNQNKLDLYNRVIYQLTSDQKARAEKDRDAFLANAEDQGYELKQ
jgi:hypothetical protein